MEVSPRQVEMSSRLWGRVGEEAKKVFLELPDCTMSQLHHTRSIILYSTVHDLTYFPMYVRSLTISFKASVKRQIIISTVSVLHT